MQKLSLTLVAAMAAGLAAGQAMAQSSGSRPPAASPPAAAAPQSSDGQPPDDMLAPEMQPRQLSDADQAFVQRAAASGMAAVQLGQLAIQKGTTTQVKQLGLRLANDTNAANQDLMQIALEANVDLPTEPDRLSMSTFQRLRGTVGSDFDTAFAQAVLQLSRRDLTEFRKESQTSKDPGLREFSKKYVQMTQQHLRLAQGISTNPTLFQP